MPVKKKAAAKKPLSSKRKSPTYEIGKLRNHTVVNGVTMYQYWKGNNSDQILSITGVEQDADGKWWVKTWMVVDGKGRKPETLTPLKMSVLDLLDMYEKISDDIIGYYKYTGEYKEYKAPKGVQEGKKDAKPLPSRVKKKLPSKTSSTPVKKTLKKLPRKKA